MSLFIAIDGLDGSGKKTQSEILYDSLISAGKKAMLLSFPNYGTPHVHLLRSIWAVLTEAIPKA